MKKFHIKKDGTPGICSADKNCPLGGEKEHFDSLEKAQERADLLNEKENLINEYKTNSKGRLKKVIQIKKINKELGLDSIDGIYSEEELREKKEREKKIEQAKLESEKRAKESQENSLAFSNLERIDFNIEKYPNDIYPLNYYSRSSIYGKTYRGESNGAKQANNGLAMFGNGLYSTTKHSYAKKFGSARKVEMDELPTTPLSFKNDRAFSQFEYEIAKKYNIEKNDLYNHIDLDKMILKMGYDGITIGPKEDMIIVRFFK